MFKILKYQSSSKGFIEIDSIEKDSWVQLYKSTPEDISKVSKMVGVSHDLINKCLDEEEQSRISIFDDYILAIINTPVINKDNHFDVSPVSFIITKDHVLAISLMESPSTDLFLHNNVDYMSLENKLNFLLNIQCSIAKSFIFYIKNIINKLDKLEDELFLSTKNSDVIKVMEIQKSITFFTMALYGNDLVIERLLKLKEKEYENGFIKLHMVSEELLDELYTENKQAIEMVNTYSVIVTNMMQSFSSMIANNQNKFMKILANITILLTIPMIFSSFWGMNVKIPFEGTLLGFWIVLFIALVVTFFIFMILWKKKMLD